MDPYASANGEDRQHQVLTLGPGVAWWAAQGVQLGALAPSSQFQAA